MKNSGQNVYPHKFFVDISFGNFIEKYDGLESGCESEDTVSIAGRVFSKRAMGKNLRFFDIKSEALKIQVMANAQ
jgi:lysyl-tRNA synthetase, class II